MTSLKGPAYYLNDIEELSLNTTRELLPTKKPVLNDMDRCCNDIHRCLLHLSKSPLVLPTILSFNEISISCFNTKPDSIELIKKLEKIGWVASNIEFRRCSMGENKNESKGKKEKENVYSISRITLDQIK